MTDVRDGWKELPDFDDRQTFVSWGVFDGVHRGHQRIVKTTVKQGDKTGTDSLLLTFKQHPVEVLTGNGPGLIYSLEKRVDLLTEFQPDYLGLVPFDRDFAEKTPKEFYDEILKKRLNVKGVCLGREARFGKNREGNLKILENLALPDEVVTVPCDHVLFGQERVSSTRIRRAISQGEIKNAGEMLGRPVTASGTVVKGQQRGKQIGYPTANLELDHDIYPPRSIYGGIAVLEEGKKFPAVSSIGIRPTFEGSAEEIVEVHILNFDRDIYGEHLEFQFLMHIREEEKFDSTDALVEQMDRDVEEFRNSTCFPDHLEDEEEEEEEGR